MNEMLYGLLIGITMAVFGLIVLVTLNHATAV